MLGASVDRAEEIKWWDALDDLPNVEGVEGALQMARESRHPDARWLESLFPAGERVSKGRMHEVMLEHNDDARAIFISYALVDEGDADGALWRAAEMGYAPAQAMLSACVAGEQAFQLAQQAASQCKDFAAV
jgi:hypothetical protein